MSRFATSAVPVVASALLVGSGAAAQRTVPAGATFVEGTVSFVAPPGFAPLTPAEPAEHFPRPHVEQQFRAAMAHVAVRL